MGFVRSTGHLRSQRWVAPLPMIPRHLAWKNPQLYPSVPCSHTNLHRAFTLFFLLCEHDSWPGYRGNYLVLNRAVLHNCDPVLSTWLLGSSIH
jgi:hypothetical protein